MLKFSRLFINRQFIFPFLIIGAFFLFGYEFSDSGNEFPVVSSKSAGIFDLKQNCYLYAKNTDQPLKFASLTKIMTAILVLENCHLNDIVTINSPIKVTHGGIRMGLQPGDSMTVNDLLHTIIIRSSNDAAIALARHTSGSEQKFIALMNKKAQELGLNNTRFQNPHGLPAKNHYSSIDDLVILTKYAFKFPKFKEIISKASYTVTINRPQQITFSQPEKTPIIDTIINYRVARNLNREYTMPTLNELRKEERSQKSHQISTYKNKTIQINLKTTNKLLGKVPGIKGVKTGYTNKAGRCLITYYEKDGLELLVVNLNNSDIFNQSEKMINYVAQQQLSTRDSMAVR